MTKTLSQDEILDTLIKSGNFHELVGMIESEWFEWIVPANRCGYIKIRALFTYEVPLCVALKSMTN
jgi:hypothetical protein